MQWPEIKKNQKKKFDDIFYHVDLLDFLNLNKGKKRGFK